MKSVKLIAADLDHTLLTEKGELPPNFSDYIDRMNNVGIHFIAASGRPMYTLDEMFAADMEKMCIISDNGGMIKVGRECIYKNLIPVETYQEMIHFTIENNIGIPVLCALDGAYVDERYAEYKQTFLRFFKNIVYVKDMEKISPDANKYTVFFPESDAKKYLREIYEPAFANDFSVTIGGEEWIDIMNKGVDKGSAIRVLAEHFNLDISQTMAFGDTYNDIEMLKAVEYSYVMKNAAPEMKQFGKFEADTNDNYGVIKVIDEMLGY